ASRSSASADFFSNGVLRVILSILGHAHEDERDGEEDDGGGERAQRRLGRGGELGGAELPPQPSRRRREEPLHVAVERRGRSRGDGLAADPLGGVEVRRQERERAPGEREPRIAV